MEIITSNKNILELAKINGAIEYGAFSFSRSYKYKFISLTNEKLVKSILYVDQNNKYILEIRR